MAHIKLLSSKSSNVGSVESLSSNSKHCTRAKIEKKTGGGTALGSKMELGRTNTRASLPLLNL
jgi:hypothetical protein